MCKNLENIIGEDFRDLGLDEELGDMTSKEQPIKEN